MSSPPPLKDLEINQDLAVQHTTWVIQRVGWIAIALFLGAALSGVFGNGPLARTAKADSQNLVHVEYDRFGRYEGDLLLRLTIAPNGTTGDTITIWIEAVYWMSLVVDHITPQPVTSSSAVDGFKYVFAREQSPTPSIVTFHIRPQSFGQVEAHLRVNNEATVRFRQFIFP